MIPYCKTDLGEEEKKAISDCIDSGWVVLGEKTQEFEEKFAQYVGAKYAVFVDSGTSALDLSVKAMKEFGVWKHKFDIDVPSLTFAATAEVLVHNGLAPTFRDVGENFCMDSSRMRALPVHLMGNRALGNACVFDSAHRIEKDDVKGSDALWCYSFYATKNITTVTGGMIALNDKNVYEWLKEARDHGLNQGTKERYTGAYKQYDVKFAGWRVKGDDLRAVIGLEQLKKLPQLTEARNAQVKRYNKAFGKDHTGNHIYPVLVRDQKEFVDYMYAQGIQTTVHFRPLHMMTAYKRYYHGEELPNTVRFGLHNVSIPLYPRLTIKEQDYIIEKVKESGMLI